MGIGFFIKTDLVPAQNHWSRKNKNKKLFRNDKGKVISAFGLTAALVCPLAPWHSSVMPRPTGERALPAPSPWLEQRRGGSRGVPTGMQVTGVVAVPLAVRPCTPRAAEPAPALPVQRCGHHRLVPEKIRGSHPFHPSLRQCLLRQSTGWQF